MNEPIIVPLLTLTLHSLIMPFVRGYFESHVLIYARASKVIHEAIITKRF